MSDVYRVGISLMMTGNTGVFLSGLSRQLLGVHAHAHDLENRLNRLGRMRLAIGGGISIAAGAAMLTGLKHITDHARELSHEMVQLKKLNIGDAGLGEVAKKAREVTDQIKGVKEVDALKAYGSSYSIFGHQDALKLMGPISQFAQVAGNTSGDYEKASNSVYEMIRAGDLLGKFVDHVTHKVDIDRLKHFLDLGAKVTLGTHGKVDAKTWLGLAQQGGPAMSGMTDQGLLTMAIAAQAMGGPRAGTAMTSLYQQMIGGKMTTPVYEALMGIGLAGGHYVTGKNGKKKLVKGGIDKDFQEALKLDPIDAVKIIKKKMEEHGHTDIEKQVPILFDILGRQTTQRIVHDLLRNLPQILNERERIAGSMGLDQSKATQDAEDYKQAEVNLKAAYENLMTDLAGPNAGTAIGIMNKLTDALRYMTGVVRGIDPDNLKRIGLGLGAIGVALIAGGAVALMAAIGPAGWLTAGLVGLAATAAMFNPEGVKTALHGLSMFYALAKSEAIIIYNHLKGLAVDPKNLDMIRSTLGATSAEFEALKTGLGKALEWYQAILGWRQKAQDTIMGLIGMVGGGDHPGMSESAREGLRAREVDPMGVFVTKLIRFFKDLDGVLMTAIDGLVKEITSWPGKLAAAIAAMGSAIVAAIGAAIKNALSNIFGGGASVTPGSFEGGGFGGATIQKASLGGGGGKLDIPDFGGGAGGTGNSAFDAIMRAEGTAGADPYNTVLGKGKYGLPSKALTDMTLQEAYAFGRTVRARHGSSSALGAFQIVGRTMKDAASGLGLDMATTRFTPEIQRRMAKWIARKQGLGAWEGFKSHPNERARARSGGWGEPDRPTVAPAPKQRELIAHQHIHLDGRKIATNVTRHQFNEGNGPATGANFADASEVYPQIG